MQHVSVLSPKRTNRLKFNFKTGHLEHTHLQGFAGFYNELSIIGAVFLFGGKNQFIPLFSNLMQ